MHKLERWQSEVLIGLKMREREIRVKLLVPLEQAVNAVTKGFAAEAGLPVEGQYVAHQEGLDMFLIQVPDLPTEEPAPELDEELTGE
jgi:hypothetical protein